MTKMWLSGQNPIDCVITNGEAPIAPPSNEAPAESEGQIPPSLVEYYMIDRMENEPE